MSAFPYNIRRNKPRNFKNSTSKFQENEDPWKQLDVNLVKDSKDWGKKNCFVQMRVLKLT